MSPSETQDDISVGDVFTPQADSAQPSIDTPANHHGADVHMGDRLSPRKQMAADGENDMQPPAFPVLMTGRQRRKKKKKQVGPADPALSTVRGFTPLASADEDSDFSTTSSRAAESRPATSVGGASPRVQPTAGHGVSALKLQLDSLSLFWQALCWYLRAVLCDS